MSYAGKYVDAFVLPLPKGKVEEYRKLAEEMRDLWLKYGALDYVECIAQDAQPGKLTSFPQAVALEDGETIVLAWAVYETRAHRDRVMEAVMKDPRMAEMNPQNIPFDGKRMFWGGFETFVTK